MYLGHACYVIVAQLVTDFMGNFLQRWECKGGLPRSAGAFV